MTGPFGESALAVWPESGGEVDVRLQQVARTLVEHPDEFSLRVMAIRAAHELGHEKLAQIADWEAVSAELWRLKRTEVIEIDYDEFVEFRAAIMRLNVFKWHSPDRAGAATRMKRSIEALQAIADVVASENEGVDDQVERPVYAAAGIDERGVVRIGGRDTGRWHEARAGGERCAMDEIEQGRALDRHAHQARPERLIAHIQDGATGRIRQAIEAANGGAEGFGPCSQAEFMQDRESGLLQDKA